MYHRTGSRVRFYIVTMNSCFICFPSDEEDVHNGGMLAPPCGEEEAPVRAVSNKASMKTVEEAPALVKGEDGMTVIPL